MSIEITKVYKEHFPALGFIGTCYTNEDRDSAGGFGKQWDEWMNNDRFHILDRPVFPC